ncbi:hypothetical protein B0T20DRAFT_438726 [Sordaria brevicollis]|uniref:Transfer RNA methyltransferase 82 n=1 Tax=Sordaria brevicollis TaxID=83679 RepID=A0AAE0UB40_SORBR|nr:hypothetical protein B0T20DRAFT_438726 [Sordaria brevicollis]
MALPYHVLKVHDGIIFAARGSNIHSFNSNFEPISVWKYPVKQEETNGQKTESETPAPTVEAEESSAPEGPPAKKRKTEDGEAAAVVTEESKEQEAKEETTTEGQTETKTDGKNQQEVNRRSRRQKQKQKTEGAMAKNNNKAVLETPFVQGMYLTTDGRHLVAITGADKTIWVFEHDGAGNLKQLSQRAMPKRPCALALTPDNKTILSADKFGDVFSLPLLFTPAEPTAAAAAATTTTTSEVATPEPTPSAPATPVIVPPTDVAKAQQLSVKPQANELTVHTLRNLKALENQKRCLERQKAAKLAAALQASQFEHTLQLGHVSMLTSVAVAVHPSHPNRTYIITADRDEHIRVSRGIPQAHVIEGFLLGHDEFVSRVCIPEKRGDVLISGGGDDDLFVWDWVSGSLLGKAAVLAEVKKALAAEEAEKVTKVAVTRIFDVQQGEKTQIFVICERIPLLLVYTLTSTNTLEHTQTLSLPGNPLDVEYLKAESKLLVSIDPNTSSETQEEEANNGGVSSILALSSDESSWKVAPTGGLKVTESAEADNSLSPQDLQKLLYTTESLRKTNKDDE